MVSRNDSEAKHDMKHEVAKMDGAAKSQAVEAALAQIERQYGKGSIMSLTDGVQVDEGIPTGSASLDLALGGLGLPRGRIVEIYGPESSGKTMLTLHAVAEAQKAGGYAAFIVAERDVLGQPRREALADALCTTMQAVPEHASALASPVKELVESATSDRRRDFVSRLLAVEQLHPTPVAREAALRAANALAGPHGRARDAVRDRLQHLSSSGDDFERTLANELLRD